MIEMIGDSHISVQPLDEFQKNISSPVTTRLHGARTLSPVSDVRDPFTYDSQPLYLYIYELYVW